MSTDLPTGQEPPRTGRELVLWILALALTLAAASYQRRTGPSYPAVGSVQIDGRSFAYRLERNALTSRNAKVAIPDPGSDATGVLVYKRHRTDNPFTVVRLTPDGDQLVGELPAQPAAGKLEYFLVLETAQGQVRVPDRQHGNVIIRFKNEVPLYILVPHILLMFVAMLIGVRAGLAAAFAPGPERRLAWTSLGVMTVGGMVLGPIAQGYAFGAFWTGFPYGYDLTDNKVLIMWLVWVIACIVIGFRRAPVRRAARLAVALAALVMLVVYLIPHSAQGTELDYELVDQGVPASKALRK